MPASDATLVLGVLNGDRDAFAELYDRRARLVRAICFDRTTDLDVAAELTQETFLRAYRGLARLRQPEHFTSWIVGIAQQVCREWRRRHQRKCARRKPWTDAQFTDQPDPPQADDRLVHLRQLLAGPDQRGSEADRVLSADQRMALHAFYLQGQNVEEARAVLGLSRSGFYRVLSLACERLRRALSRPEVQP